MTKRPGTNIELIRSVLGSEYLEHQIVAIGLEEDCAAATSRVRVDFSIGEQPTSSITGEGVGLVDALAHALIQRFASEYKSLESIEFIGFSVNAEFETKQGPFGSDAMGHVTLQVRNSEGQLFEFADSSRSVASSAARAVLAAVEYFVNAERAYLTLYRALQDAKERNRPDLIGRYTRELSEVVKSTSYAEVIENIRKEVDAS